MDSVNTDIYSRSQHYRQAMCNSLTADAAKPLIQAFVSCCLDYCNSLLYGVPDSLIRKLQSVQNGAVPLITGTRRCDHITPVPQQLHWLVRRRVDYSIKWHAWCTSHCQAMHPGIWLMTSTLLPTAVVIYFDQHMTGHARCLGHAPASVTEVSALLDHVWNALPLSL